ncbi:MAG: tRNA dihydrouridine synthase DusB [Anaerolineae bacterium]|nr:tRNA dihydrouridine synthase DusB [Anaerolineae bacterium]
MTQPTFHIAGIPIYGDAILAPLAGYGDPPYRQLCREFGSVMSYTALLDTKALHYNPERTREMVSFRPEERPRVCQLFGSEVALLVEAAPVFASLGADIIDLNLGCSVRKIVSRGAGAALLCDLPLVGRMIAQLNKAVSIPVTAKIRLGWDAEHRNYLEIARVLVENGAALIAVHGRTAADTYREPADWDAIAEIKQAVNIPVIGNGDVKCAADIARLKNYTGCDAVMIGRAAIGNPWIFQGRDQADVPLAERYQVMRYHLQMMVAHHGPERSLKHFRKHLIKYMRGIPNASTLRRRWLAIENVTELLDALRNQEVSAQ